MSCRRHRVVQGVLVGALLALGSCSLFVDTEGLSGGPALDTGDSGSVDTGTPDGVAPTDAGSEASVLADADAAPVAFCAAHPGHTLCFDFDESTSVPHSDDDEFDSTKLFIDDGQSVSAPQSLHSRFPPGVGYEGLTYYYDGSGRSSLAFEARIDAVDIDEGELILLGIDLPDSDGITEHSFYVESYHGQFHVAESWNDSTNTTQYFSPASLLAATPNHTWLHVELAFDGTTKAVTGAVDGTPVSGATTYGFPAGTMDLGFGGYAQDFSSETELYVDDVVFDK